MKKLLLLLALPVVGFAAPPRPNALQAVTPENIPMSAGAVTNIYVSASTVTTVTVPYYSDTFIASGDPLWVCEDASRCGSTFPASTVSVTGWVYNPSGRMLKGNLQVSTSLIYVYARPQDMVSTTAQNLGAFEWSKRQNAN